LARLPDWVYKLAEEVLVESIKYPTVLGKAYEDLAKYYAEALAKHGVHVTLHTVPREYAEKHLLPEHNQDKPRVIVLARAGKGGRVLQFNGHYDVVAPGEGWSVTEPFKPKRVGYRVYGRGASDMKGGVAAVLAALAYMASREDLDIVVEAALVPDEEIGGATGTGYLVNVMGSRPDWAVIAEPSGLDNMWIGHKGLVWGYVKVYGKQAHGSTPWLGDNAFEKAVLVAKYFMDYYISRLKERRSSYEYDTPGGEHPTITMGGRVIAPGSINVVPGVSGFSVDRRLIVEERADEVLRELVEFVEKAARELGVKAEFTLVEKMNPALTDPNSTIARKLAESAREVLGFEPRKTVCVGGLDMRYYTYVGVEAVTYGPGDRATPHKADEYIDVRDIHRAAEIYVNLAYKLASSSA